VAIALAAILVFVVGGVLAVVLLTGGDDAQLTAVNETTSSTTDWAPDTTTTSGETTTSGVTTTTEAGSTPVRQTRYCKKMSILQLTFSNFRSGTLTDFDFDEMVAGLDALTPIAPAEVAPDLDTFVGGLTSMQSLLDKLDITFEQFQDVAFLTDAAEDWTPEQVQQIQNVTTQLTDPAFVSAGTDIDTHYRTRC
jgi:hypothetical protein